MAGAAPIQNSKGGKKALDAAINLVPFIDLLSCCISFLLITAVWTSLCSLSVAPTSTGTGPTEPIVPVVSLSLSMDRDGFTYAESSGERRSIPLKGSEYDYLQLASVLRTAKASHPELRSLVLSPADAINYDRIVRTMDVILSAEFWDIRLSNERDG